MEWKELKSESAFYEIQELSAREKVLIFKHDPNCVVSFMIKQLLQREWNQSFMNMKTYLIDSEISEDLSNNISHEFGIDHVSPQALIISKDKCIYTKSNGYIQYKDLKEFANR